MGTQVNMPFEANTIVLITAAFAGMVLVFHSLKKHAYTSNEIALFMLMAWSLGLILGKAIFLLNAYISYPPHDKDIAQWFSSIAGGNVQSFAFYGYSSLGGLAGAALGAFLFCRIYKHPLLELLDACVLPVLFMYGLVRTGCALQGCCYGIELGKWLFPVQWLDFGLTMLLCLIIFLRYRRHPEGCTRLRLFLLIYPVQRFMLEFLRGDSGRGMVGPFSTTQLLCVLAFALGLAMLYQSRRTIRQPT